MKIEFLIAAIILIAALKLFGKCRHNFIKKGSDFICSECGLIMKAIPIKGKK